MTTLNPTLDQSAKTPLRRRIRNSGIALAIGATLVTAPVLTTDATFAPSAHAAAADIVSTPEATKNAWRQDILNQVNSYRASKGLYPFKYSNTITQIAQAESDRAVRDENYNHSMNFLSDRRAGTWTDAGEITALSYKISTKDLVDFWKNSKSHNKIMLSTSIDVIGIGTTQVDGMLTKKKEPWRLVGVIDGFSYNAGKAPSDTRTSVTGGTVSVQSTSSRTINGHTIKGDIYKRWNATGGSNGWGNPTMSERSIAGGGVYQVFQKGNTRTKVLWKSGIGSRAIIETGAIGQQWSKAGYERGYGFPSTDERPIAGGGVYQVFKKGNSMTKVMWKSGVGSGAVKESGAIGQQWMKAGYERGYGHPITDEYNAGNGVISQKFKKGNKVTKVNWKSGRGVWVG